ncbi:MogA/MoaB family molybdenum cofactor biosynthesis protein [Virgibacillus sediminis]|uniref:Molybdenum cofactor biosynthesis protein B n=1 Tax=Virgibacillus sediminis TaxID=202260 RepID=A0ABV7A9Y2_9BACI
MLEKHREASPKKVACAVITVSDTGDEHTDESGKLMKKMLQDEGHRIVEYRIVPDQVEDIQSIVTSVLDDSSVEAVLINGGTGIAKRDVTIESLDLLFDKAIPGFGELFRMLSYQYDIGSASMLSRAVAGISGGRVIFATPGSSGAVKLAMEKLILPELGHTVMELAKDSER